MLFSKSRAQLEFFIKKIITSNFTLFILFKFVIISTLEYKNYISYVQNIEDSE
jgi:hypothetical protein